MKKTGFLLAVLLLAGALLTACGGNQTESDDKSLYEHGLELVALMEEMAENESYFALYSGDPALKEIISAAGDGDHSAPKAVYRITIAEEVLYGMTEMADMQNLSDTLKEYAASRVQATVATQINAAGGVKALAASSVCTAGKTFVSSELTENTMYLYTYENAVPAIVTFVAGEDSTVSAGSFFILNESFESDSLQAVEQFFSEVGAVVEEVNP